MSGNKKILSTLDAVGKQYLRKAAEAYERREFKLALLLLKNLLLDSEESVFVLINSAYYYWKQHETQLSPTENDVLNVMNDCFTKILSIKVDSLMQPFDYIKLSHIYISEASLEGALKIMNLASARGYMESSLVVLQTWSVLKRLGEPKEYNKSIAFLCSSISTGTKRRDEALTGVVQCVEGSALPVSFVILHCVLFLKKQAQSNIRSNQQRKKDFRLLSGLLAEAYLLWHFRVNEDMASLAQWFGGKDVWMEVGRALANTPFLLLSEDSYWEAFVRVPTEREALESVVQSMTTHRRRAKVLFLLANAMKVYPWNMYCRNTLEEVEQELFRSTADRKWTLLFQYEAHAATLVQSVVRMWRTRVRWPLLREKLRLIRNLFQMMVDSASEHADQRQRNFMRMIVRRWREWATDWQRKTNLAALRIQCYWRRSRCLKLYYPQKFRRRAANANFLLACQIRFDFARVVPLRRWHVLYMETKKARCATLLRKALYMHFYNKPVTEGLQLILRVVRARWRHNCQVRFREWRRRFLERRRNHARITVRFFVRGVFERMRLREQEKGMAGVEDLVTKRTEVMFQQNQLPVLKDMWGRWREELQKKREAQSRRLVAITFQRYFWGKKGRLRARGMRLRQETQGAFVRRAAYWRLAKRFFPWRTFAATVRLQRFVRGSLAKKKLGRLQAVSRGCEEMIAGRRERRLVRVLWCWDKYCYLWKREQNRAARRIVQFFRVLMSRALIRRANAKKIAAGNLVFCMHKYFSRSCMRQLQRGTIHAHLYRVLSAFVCRLEKGTLRRQLVAFRASCDRQHLLSRLVYCLILRPLERRFWVGVSCSVGMRTVDEYHHSDSLLFPATETEESDVLESRFKVWERPVPAGKCLLSMSLFGQLKAFSSWMSLFRLRQRHKRGASLLMTRRLVINYQEAALRRWQMVLLIQCSFRCHRARGLLRSALSSRRKLFEFQMALRVICIRASWWRVKATAERRSQARLVLQCFFRATLSKRRSNRRKLYCESLQQRSIEIGSSQRQKLLVRRLWVRWQEQFRESVLSSTGGYCVVRAESRAERREKKKGVKMTHNQQQEWGAGSEEEEEGDTPAAQRRRQLRDYERRRAARPQHEQGEKVGVKRARADKKRLFSQSTSALSAPPVTKPNHSGTSQLKAGGSTKHLSDSQPNHSRRQRAKELQGLSFQSEECHRYLFRLKQSGVFLFDVGAVAALRPEEVQFCLAECDTVFCQHPTDLMLAALMEHFQGDKVVLCGGELTLSAARLLWTTVVLGRRQAEGVSLQLVEIRLSACAVVVLSKLLAGVGDRTLTLAAGQKKNSRGDGKSVLKLPDIRERVSFPKSEQPSTFACTEWEESLDRVGRSAAVSETTGPRELCFDDTSVGSLGLCLLMQAAETNRSVRVLVVKGRNCPPLLGDALTALSRSSALQELRLFGMILSPSALSALLEGLKKGFPALSALEFCCPSPAQHIMGVKECSVEAPKEGSTEPSVGESEVELAEQIVQVAKDRAYGGGKGVSVTLNYQKPREDDCLEGT